MSGSCQGELGKWEIGEEKVESGEGKGERRREGKWERTWRERRGLTTTSGF